MDVKEGLSPALEKYVIIIYHEELKGAPVKASTIASAANVTRATVTRTLKTLSDLGYINYSPYAPISFTEKGLRYSIQLVHKSLIIEKFLTFILNIDPEIVKEHALLMTNTMPKEVLHNLGEFTLFLMHKKEFWQHWDKEAPSIVSSHREKGLKMHNISAE